MTFVKPPTFNEILRQVGSRRKAVQYLAKLGYTCEKIVEKSGLPRFLVNIYLFGEEPKSKFPFIKVSKTFDRIALLRSRRGKETELTSFLKIPEIDFETKVRLALAKIFDENPKVGPGLIEKAIAIAAGCSPEKVHSLFNVYGEHGEVAALLLTSTTPKLTVGEVYEAIRIIPKIEKTQERIFHISSLLKQSTPEEARYIVRLILQDLKLGYHENTVISSLSRVLQVDRALIENVSAILGVVEAASIALKGGNFALSSVKIRPGQFLKPQLAHLYEPDKIQFPVLVEYKYDGSRLQLHKWGSQIWLFSRRGIEKSKTLPEIVEVVNSLGSHSVILDSEVVAVSKDGKYLPFQYLLERTVPRELKKEEIKRRMEEVSLTVRIFDVLYLNGRVLIDLPLKKRREYLVEIVPREYLAEGVECSTEVEVMKFYQEALKLGLEGVIVKSLNSTYVIGQRTDTWLKFKPERDTVDAVIVKALYGKGERSGYYSSFVLAVRDPNQKKLYTIGRVSNLSEELMAYLKEIVEKTKIREDVDGVFVKPSVVLEVTYQEIQETDEYTSGYALRVPKFVRLREDKSVEDVDTLDKLKKLYELQYERFKLQDL